MIIKRYIQQEILQNFLGILALLVLIFVSKYYVSYLADAAAGEIPGSAVFELLIMKIMSVLSRFVPVALLLSVLIAFSRLQRDKELIIMSTCGLRHQFYFAVVLKLACIFFIPYAFMVLFSNPWFENRIDLVKSHAKKESNISGLSAGQFKEFSQGDRVVYIESIAENRKSMEQVFVQVRQNGRLGVMTSQRAYFKWHDDFGKRYVVFKDGIRYVGNPGSVDYEITEYETYALLVDDSEPNNVSRHIESISTINLLRMGDDRHWAELQTRFSNLILFLYLPLLAVILSIMSYEDKQYALILMCMLIYFFYSNMINICQSLIEKSQLSASIGAGCLHILMFIVLLMIYKWPQFRHYFNNAYKHRLSPAA